MAATRVVGQVIILMVFIAGSAVTPFAMAHGDLQERIAAITVQILANQAAPELWLQRADLNRQHGDFSAARSDLDHATQLKPGWAAVHLQLARISFDSGQFVDCEQAATECLKLESSNIDARVLRARSLVQLGKLERVVADYDVVLNSTNSAAPMPDLYLERARALAGLQRWDDAIRGLDAGMARVGATPALALPAIEYERKRGAFGAALARLERARGFFSEKGYGKMRVEILQQRDSEQPAPPNN
ncbi:MAG: tetratricopeptide repeat protein [bacterium]